MPTRCVYLSATGHKLHDFEIGKDPSDEKPGEPLRKMVVVIGPSGSGKSEIPDALEILNTGRFDQVAGRKTAATKNVDLLDLVGRETDSMVYRGAYADPFVTINRSIGWATDKEGEFTGKTFHNLSTSLGDGSPTEQQKKIDKKFGENPIHFSVLDLLRGSDTDRRNKFLELMEAVATSITLAHCIETVGDLPKDVGSDEESPIAWLQDIRGSVHKKITARNRRQTELTAERKSVTDAVTEAGDLASLKEVEADIAEIGKGRDQVIKKIAELDALAENRKSIEKQIADAQAMVYTAEGAADQIADLTEKIGTAETDCTDAEKTHEEAASKAAELESMHESAVNSYQEESKKLSGINVTIDSAKTRLKGASSGTCPLLLSDCALIDDAARKTLEDEIVNAESDLAALNKTLDNLRAERDEIKSELIAAESALDTAREAALSAGRALTSAQQALTDANTAAAGLKAATADVARLQKQLDAISDLSAREDMVKKQTAYDEQLVLANGRRDEVKKAQQNEERLAEVRVELADVNEEIEKIQTVLKRIDDLRIEAISELVDPLVEHMRPLLGDLGVFEISLQDAKGNVVFRPGLRSPAGPFRRLEQLSDGEMRIVWPAFCRGLAAFQTKAGYRPLIINSFETISEDKQEGILSRLLEELADESLCQVWITWNAKRKRLPELLVEAESVGAATIINLWPEE